MKRVLYLLGSTRLAVALLCTLGVAIAAERLRPSLGATASTTLGCVLGVCLLSALIVSPRARHGFLGAFHFALLAVILLVTVGQLTRFEGRVEVTTGTPFDLATLTTTRRGPWHEFALRAADFSQGRFTVDYTPGNRRGATQSTVLVAGAAPQVVGDDRPLVIRGYRLYTTHNKGFAPIIEWSSPAGETALGSIHMPPFPLFDWKQANEWRAPDGSLLRTWLKVNVPRGVDREWRLESDTCDCQLVLEYSGVRHDLRLGETALLTGGTRLRFAEMRGWMGYRIFYDPTLPWLLAAALIGCAAFAAFVFRATGRRSVHGESTSTAPPATLPSRLAPGAP